MVNKELKDFKNCLHSSLKAIQKGAYFVVKEQEEKSKIQEIKFNFDQKDDVLIIQQDVKNCPSITNLFGNNGDKIESCDFIVLLIKNKELKIFFCEIKSKNTEATRKKAEQQIKSSKIFFEYLYKSYLHKYNKYNKNDDFSMAIENAKSLILYPTSMSQKYSVASMSYGLISCKMELDDNRVCYIADGYKFFESK
ncbi:hypothetical protein [Helicobacter sp. 10-6591]|uniref:hypothetical protein n=1 Tax=Helicobacter sp. 10-6591 TaxID=2004998 RepID=UPI000DCC43CA|nr:hypothetical protein [Helicobacter sp. 10-6591]RAX54603.1 hypothetical protein CCY97_05675 [Helicobacter sp. 10-6591]